MREWATSVLRLVFVLTGIVTHAQWLNYKTPGVPRIADGKAEARRAAATLTGSSCGPLGCVDARPDALSELRRLFGPLIEEEIKNELPGMEAHNIHKYVLNVLADFPPGNSPARPDTAKAYEHRLTNPEPRDLCDATDEPAGFPILGLLSEPIKIVQAPRLTMVLYEIGGHFRQIYADGRTLPAETNLPAYFGYSVGRWERDTFVVETAGFNEKTLLDVAHPHSDQLHVIERFRRRGLGHLDVEMTFEDPKMYTLPFIVTLGYHLLADDDIFEMYPENEKDCAHIRTAQTSESLWHLN